MKSSVEVMAAEAKGEHSRLRSECAESEQSASETLRYHREFLADHAHDAETDAERRFRERTRRDA